MTRKINGVPMLTTFVGPGPPLAGLDLQKLAQQRMELEGETWKVDFTPCPLEVSNEKKFGHQWLLKVCIYIYAYIYVNSLWFL